MQPAQAIAVGLLHGPAELLPVSSSAHVALLGVEIDQATAVAVHAGTALALLDRLRWEPVLLVPAGAISLAAAHLLEEAAERRLGSRRGIAAGMLAGAGALALADRTHGQRERPVWADGVALGLAQAAALWPGVSRHGATVAAGRARGLGRRAAVDASWTVGVPTLLGAAAFKARSAPPRPVHLLAAGAAFASALAARPLLRREDALWPFAAYRAGVALALLR